MIDGSLDAGYGTPLATQTNNTSFGKNTQTNGLESNGSELDAAYGVVQGTNLDLFFAGNISTDYTHFNIFIANGSAGQSTLETQAGGGGGGALAGMNGSTFSPGFQATYALDINGGPSTSTTPTFYVNQYDLTQPNTAGSYLGSFDPTTTGTSGTVGTGNNKVTFSFNNSNTTGGVTGTFPSAVTDSTGPNSVTTGFELSIPLAALGNIAANSLEILADINGNNGDTYLSNQFLPGLPLTNPNTPDGSSSNLAAGNNPFSGPTTGGFTFASTPGMYFTVMLPASGAVNGSWIATGSGNWNASTPANWAGGNIPQNPADTATFGTSITGPATVTLTTSETVGKLTFNSPTSYTIAASSGSTLTINDTGDSAGVNPFISVEAGSHTISAPVSLTAGVTIDIANTTALTISGAVGGTGPVAQSGAGALVLSGANTYSGALQILAGSVELDNNSAASTGLIDMGNPLADDTQATLIIGTAGLSISNAIESEKDDEGTVPTRLIATTFASGSATLSGTLTLDGGMVFSVPTGDTLNLTNTIGNGTSTANTVQHYLMVNNNNEGGSVVLSGANTYTGDTDVNSGMLTLTSAGSLATDAVNVGAAGTANINGTLTATPNLSSNGTLNIGAGTGSGIRQLLVNAITVGANNTSGVIALAAPSTPGTRTVLVANSLAFGGTGQFVGLIDLSANDMVLHNGNIFAIAAAVAEGYNGGNWQGSGGITSSSAAHASNTALAVEQNDNGSGSPLLSTFDGVSVVDSDVLIKYTYFGDANLDGVVNGDDYTLIDNGFNNNLTGWNNGDFNYDGIVNGDDYTLIDNAFNTQGPSLAAVGSAVIANPSSLVAVPEPASLAAIGIGALGMLMRRRRN